VTARELPRADTFAGGANLLRHELSSWRRTGRWWRQAVAWSAVLGGLFVAVHWVLPAVMPADAGLPPASVVQSARQSTELAAIVLAIGVVFLTEGLILDQRRDGALEWLLSKPLTRPALIGARFLAQGAGLVATAVLLPWIVVHLLLSLAEGSLRTPGPTLGAAGMLALLVVFHLALVLALSTVTTRRSVVLSVPLVLIVGADLVATALPWTFEVQPWMLGRIAGAYLGDGVLVTPGPMLATIAWTVALLVVAMWRLDRTEL
jgi:hypothetical protein